MSNVHRAQALEILNLKLLRYSGPLQSCVLLFLGLGLPQFSDRLNANAPSGLAPAAKPLRVSLADYAAGGQYV